MAKYSFQLAFQVPEDKSEMSDGFKIVMQKAYGLALDNRAVCTIPHEGGRSEKAALVQFCVANGLTFNRAASARTLIPGAEAVVEEPVA